MKIWKKPISLDILNHTSTNTLIEHLNIVYTDIGDDWLSATMPVCSFTHQPMGLLHGGASVVLAETLGSVAGFFSVDENSYCVGIDINANHMRGVRSGTVTGTAVALHRGAMTQVWQIDIRDEKNRLVCASRITLAVKHHTAKDKT
ncbi:hotdog fold thioesterase [Vibrio palustris]|uniref:Putative esterase n=1 Tax=Vibrio palustris TaxID=1918946 RepID=A0A1R4B4N2_9VIBR|nr:hotdog fold thioesterase [Vibrio palustris]SJL83870.1 Putative esterase [Vibrio palustris]